MERRQRRWVEEELYYEDDDGEPPYWQKFKDCCRHLTAFLFSHVGVCVLVVGYTIMGAFVFQEIEGDAAKEDTSISIMRQEWLNHRNSTIKTLWKITVDLNQFNVDADEWRSRVAEEVKIYGEWVVDKYLDQPLTFSNASTMVWSFPGAFLYSLTVITTIGYGHIVPSTAWGKMTTVLYGIVGMPLFLLYLSNIGDFLATAFKWGYARCCLCRGARRQRELKANARLSRDDDDDVCVELDLGGGPSGMSKALSDASRPAADMDDDEDDEQEEEEEAEEEEEDSQQVTVPISLCLSLMLMYVCGGAKLFSSYENWDFLDGSYFCFISLSTIGFGDIVPGDHSEEIQLSFIFCSIYLLVGMALIAMCFNLMQEEVVHKVRMCGKRMGCGGGGDG